MNTVRVTKTTYIIIHFVIFLIIFIGSLILYPIYLSDKIQFGYLFLADIASTLVIGKGIIDFFGNFNRTRTKVRLTTEQRKDIKAHLSAGLQYQQKNQLSNFINEYIGTNESNVPFVGRDLEMKRLWSWLDNRKKAYLLLVSPAGRGKSSLLIRWALELIQNDEWKVVFIPISNRFDTTSPINYFSIMAKRLSQAFGDFIPENSTNSLEIWTRICANYLDPSKKKKNQKIVMIIDGLDESSDHNWRRWQRLFTEAGVSIPVIFSARLIANDKDSEGWKSRLNLQKNVVEMELNLLRKEDIVTIIQIEKHKFSNLKVKKEIEKELFRLTNGDPLLIQLFLFDLKKRIKNKSYDDSILDFSIIETLKKITPDYSGYFQKWWKDQYSSWEEQGYDPKIKNLELLSLLRLLALAKGPLSGRDLEVLLPAGEADNSLINSLVSTAPRVIIGDAETGYTLSHPKFHKYFLKEEQISKKKIEELQEAFINYGLETLNQLFESEIKPVQVSSYLLKHLREHLVEGINAGIIDDNILLGLRNKGWVNAHEIVLGTLSNYLDDVMTIWEYSRSVDGNRIEWQIWAGLTFSSISSSYTKFKPNILKKLLHLKDNRGFSYLTINQARSLLNYEINAYDKFKLLFVIIIECEDSTLRDLLIEESLEIISDIQIGWQKCGAIVNIISLTHHSKREELLRNAIETANNIAYSPNRISAKLDLFPYLSTELRSLVAKDLVNDIMTVSEKWIACRYYIQLGLLLSSSEGKRLINLGLNMANSLPLDYYRSKALGSIADLLPEEQGEQIRKNAVNIALTIEDTWFKDEVLSELIYKLPLKQCLTLLKEIEVSDARDRILSRIISELPFEDQLSSIKSIRSDFIKYYAIDHLVDILECGDIIPVINSIKIENLKNELLLKVSEFLSIDEREKIVNKVKLDCRKIGDIDTWYKVKAKLISQLPTHEKKQQFEKLIEELDNNVENNLEQSIISTIFKFIPEEFTNDQLAKINIPQYRIDILLYKMQIAQQGQKEIILDDLIRNIEFLEDKKLAAMKLAELSNFVEPLLADDFCQRAYEYINLFKFWPDRFTFLANTISRMPSMQGIKYVNALKGSGLYEVTIASIMKDLPQEIGEPLINSIVDPFPKSRAIANSNFPVDKGIIYELIDSPFSNNTLAELIVKLIDSFGFSSLREEDFHRIEDLEIRDYSIIFPSILMNWDEYCRYRQMSQEKIICEILYKFRFSERSNYFWLLFNLLDLLPRFIPPEILFEILDLLDEIYLWWP